MNTSTCTRLSVLAASLLFTMGSADLIASSAAQNSPAMSLEDGLQKQAQQFSDRDERSTYIIQLHEEPVARYRGGIPGFEATSRLATGEANFNPRTLQAEAYRDYLMTRQDEVLAGIAAETGVSLNPERRWQYAVNGFAAEMDGLTARKISAMPEVKHIKRELHRVPLTFAGPEYVGAPDIWEGGAPSELETKGEGTVVAIFDTGVNWDHVSFAEEAPADGYVHENPLGDGVFLGVCDAGDPDYNADANCNNKFIGAYDVVGGDGNDDNGHGTHVAGTAAGNELATPNGLEISGVAPRANVISYRVCTADGCGGGVDAAEHVLANHAELVDTINYSIGPMAGGGDPYGETTAQAFLSLNEAGILVAAAGGNSGPGASTISNFGPWNMTVASNHHGQSFETRLSVTGPEPVPGDLENLLPIPAVGLFVDPALEAGVVAAVDVDSENDAACDPLPADSMDGMIGLAELAGCPFADKAVNMADAGAIGAILYSGADYDFSTPALGGEFPIPTVWVEYPLSLDLLDWVTNEEDPTAEFHQTELIISNQHAMAGSSSRGPGMGAYPELPGPDVVAPGASIFAAWIGGEEEFMTIGGTSMASPHVAGGIALMRALYPDWSATEIQSALMLSANPDPVLKEDGSTPATVYDRGNGLMTLGAAANAGLVLDETKANFDDADPNGGSLELHELNVPFLANADCEEGCSWTRTFKAVQDGDWTASATGNDFVVAVSPSNFSLLEGETQEVTITVTDPVGEYFEWLFGEVLLSEDSGNASDARMPVLLSLGTPPPVEGNELDLDGIEVPGGIASARELEINPDDGFIEGIEWSLTYQTAGFAWLDEFRMELVAPDGTVMLAGGAAGADSAEPDEELDHDFGWPGAGGTDSDAQTVADFDGMESDGTWTVRLWNSWAGAGGTLIDGSMLTFHIGSEAPAPIIGTVSVTDVTEDSATVVAEVDPNDWDTTVTLSHGTSDDDLGSTLDPVHLEAADGMTEIENEITGLSCGMQIHYQVTAVNDEFGYDSHSDVSSFNTAECASDDDDDGDDSDGGDAGDGSDDDATPPSDGGGSSGSFLSCSMSDGKGAVDPLLPLLGLLAMVGLFARRRV